MKRAFTLLFIIVVVLYAKEAYRTYQSTIDVVQQLTGSLSDIAEEVTAIPLQLADGHRIKKASNVRREGSNLFLISEGMLYRYKQDGNFVCRISNPDDINVAGYLINPLNQELIVLGNEDDVFYYDFEGRLIEKKKLKSEHPNRQILSLSLHNNRIWTIEENSYQDPDTQQIYVHKEVITYDTSFHKIESRKLTAFDLGRTNYMIGLLQPRLCLDHASGNLFAHCASLQPEQLLQDTLYLKKTWSRQTTNAWSNKQVPVSPVNPAGRFWLSAYRDSYDNTKDYTFCFDTKTYQYKQIEGGLKDNFYDTGSVMLESMDIYNDSYCYVKSGEVVKKAFPNRQDAENAVVFIVKLKMV